MILLSAVAVLLSLYLVYRVWADWLFSPVGLFVLMFMLSYGLRIVLISIGLDSAYPEYLFRFGAPMLTANLYLILFILMCASGLYVTSQAGLRLRYLFPETSGRIDVDQSFRVATTLTVVWLVITAYLFTRYGGFSSMVRASKVQKEFAGLFILLTIPTAGIITSILTFLLVLRERVGRFTGRQRALAVRSLTYALFDGIGVFFWGARSLLVLTAVQLVIGYFVFRPQPLERRQRSPRARIAIGLVVALSIGVVLVVGLRIIRDQALSSNPGSSALHGQSAVRQLSVAANAVHYDAFLLAARDFPSTYRLRGGVDIYNGAVGIIPRAIWKGKPKSTGVGAWFRQVYEPNTKNGWPLGAPGVWYLNFGAVGVMIGGLLTGIVLSAASRSMAASRTNPLAFVMATAVGVWVINDGVDGEFVVKWAQFVLPMLVLLPVMRSRRRPAPAPVSSSL